MNLQETNELVKSIRRLNLKNTNFKRIMAQHAQSIQEFLARKASGAKPFEDKESYFAFCAAIISFSKAKHMVFNDNNEDFGNAGEHEDKDMPAIKAFHYTNDEKEMHKTLDFESIKYGDVLHLIVVDEEKDKFKLQILNKYGENKRIVDSLLFADLIKDNPLVKLIVPPLKKSDLIRAVVFGNVKLEVGVYTNRLVSLNSKFVKNAELKDLKLGRVTKKEILFYPVDISGFLSFGKYLENHNIFENPKQVPQRTAAFKCHPSETGPFYDVRCKKHIRVPVDGSLSEAAFDLISVCKKTVEAEELLRRAQLNDALKKIDEALILFPDNSRALTVRGKIFFAMSAVASTLNKKNATRMKQNAYLSFVDALKISFLNVEAVAFHDSILKDAIRLNPVREKEIRSRLLRPNHVDSRVEAFKTRFKSGNIQQVEREVVIPKQEPMDM